MLLTLTADIGAGVALLADDSVRKPTLGGALSVVTKQYKYSTLFEHAPIKVVKDFIKSEGVMV